MIGKPFAVVTVLVGMGCASADDLRVQRDAENQALMAACVNGVHDACRRLVVEFRIPAGTPPAVRDDLLGTACSAGVAEACVRLAESQSASWNAPLVPEVGQSTGDRHSALGHFGDTLHALYLQQACALGMGPGCAAGAPVPRMGVCVDVDLSASRRDGSTWDATPLGWAAAPDIDITIQGLPADAPLGADHGVAENSYRLRHCVSGVPYGRRLTIRVDDLDQIGSESIMAPTALDAVPTRQAMIEVLTERALAEQQCREGLAPACALAATYGAADGASPAEERALQQRGCERGSAPACLRYAERLLGESSAAARTEAESALDRACNAIGDPQIDACDRLGERVCAGGTGTTQELRCAALLAPHRCANAGAFRECNWLGDVAREGRFGSTPDAGLARTFYERACWQWSGMHCGPLAELLAKGGDAADLARARKLAFGACAHGDFARCGLLGALFADGRGGAVEVAAGRRFQRIACTGGVVAACGGGTGRTLRSP